MPVQPVEEIRMEFVIEHGAFAADQMGMEVVGLPTIDREATLPTLPSWYLSSVTVVEGYW
jgi:hypothetical protein